MMYKKSRPFALSRSLPLLARLSLVRTRMAMTGAWKIVALALILFRVASSSHAAAWYVDNSLSSSANVGTNWANAWTNLNLASGVNPGDTVYISGGNVSQTYWLTNTTWQLVSGTNNAPVTYRVGQDSGYNGTVVLNGGSMEANAINGTPGWVTINGGYNGQNHLVVSNFICGSFYLNGCSNVVLQYVTVYGAIQLLSPIAVEIGNLVHYPPPGATKESATIPAAISPAYYSAYYAAMAGNTSYTASLFIHDSTIYVLRDGTTTGEGDICVGTDFDHSTLSNCYFASIVNPAYNGGKHQEALQFGADNFLRMMDCTVVNMEYAGAFGGPTSTSVHDLQFFNNVFYYTDPLFTNGSAAVDIIIGEGGATNLIYNVLVANNTFADANYGLQIGPYDQIGSYSNVVVVNNLCTNNSQAGISCVTTNAGPLTNAIVCFYNKAGGNTVTPVNLAGPSTSGEATFVSYTPYAANNDFHLAANDTGATGNGTNWPSACFGADKDGNPRPASGPWDIGAYQYSTNGVAPTPPVAAFDATPTSGTAPLTVTFTDTSTGSITGRSWQFGDGNVTNTTATTVVYQYAGTGTDTVQLVVSGPGGSGTNVQANLITVSATGNTNSVPPPVAAFSGAPTSGTAPLTVTFTDASTGSITNRLWHFGDGTSTNTLGTTMVHQYTTPGTNTVRLNVYGPGGTRGAIRGNMIVVTSTGGNTNSVPAPVASFGATPTSGTTPLTVTFTDTSTGSITSRAWQFGDGNTMNTTATTVTYVYTAPGADTVQLIVNGPGGSSTNVQANLITVSATGGNTNSVPAPVASFGATPTSGTVPLTVTFTDTSTGSITGRSWQFGDGNVANTTATTVIHQYTASGTDTVQLVVSGPGGSGTNVQANLITVSAAGNTNSVPPPVASFSAAPTSGTAPLTVTFTDTSTGSITNRLWSFGDGSSANTLSTTVVHHYTTSGTNTVQLTVSGLGGTGVGVQGNLVIVSPGGGTNGVAQTRGHYLWRFQTAY
jgi:PKD repeat protein